MDLTFRPARTGELALAVEIDDDACEAYRAFGLPFDFGPDHPFARMERERWAKSEIVMACADDVPVGFAALGLADGKPHLEQLSVRLAFMKRGIGTALLERAIRWRDDDLWITTYDHVPWNAPWYARFGFVIVPYGDAPAEIRTVLDAARGVLPQAEHQVAMVRWRAA